MHNLDFDKATKVARDNVEKLVPNAKNVTLEEAMISEDRKLYEVTYSYDIDREYNPLGAGIDNISKLAALMGRRREYKIFLVGSDDFQFRGFRNYNKER